jgi:acyl-CoA synthetase (AMP-forming)/AMP-acid ligase II
VTAPQTYADLASIVDLLELRAEREPDRAAYLYLADGERDEQLLTYGELSRRAKAIAVQLAERTRFGDRALLLYPPGLDFIAGVFGCLYAGLVAVPSYPPDPTRPERSLPRLRAIGRDADAAVVLATDLIAANQASLFQHAEELAGLPCIATDRVDAAAAADWKRPPLAPAGLAVIQ